MKEKNFIITSKEDSRKLCLVEVPGSASIVAGALVRVRETDARSLKSTETYHTAICDMFALDVHGSTYRMVLRRLGYELTDADPIVVALYAEQPLGEDTNGGDSSGDDTGSDNTDPIDTGDSNP